jgi:hypothetical protein
MLRLNIRKMHVRIIVPMLIAVVMACIISGCATMAIGLNYGKAEAKKEVRKKEKIQWEQSPCLELSNGLNGSFIGYETIGDENYIRILLNGNLNPCRVNAPIELLLPSGIGSAKPAILREASSKQDTILNDDGRIKIIMLLPYNQEAEIENILSNEKWLGYPTNVIISGCHRLGAVELNLAYRTGKKKNEYVSFILSDTTALEYVCRKKEATEDITLNEYYLYPFAIAFDLITLPIQIIVFTVMALSK